MNAPDKLGSFASRDYSVISSVQVDAIAARVFVACVTLRPPIDVVLKVERSEAAPCQRQRMHGRMPLRVEGGLSPARNRRRRHLARKSNRSRRVPTLPQLPSSRFRKSNLARWFTMPSSSSKKSSVRQSTRSLRRARCANATLRSL